MRIPRIHTEQPLEGQSTVMLDGQAAQHLLKVLRLGPGHPLELFNGDGRVYPGAITETTKKSLAVTLEVPFDPDNESPLSITLGQVVSRGDRMDYAVQKAVEMGVTTIQPLTSERCEVRLKGDREDKRLRHWQQVAISAAEQCGRARVPEVQPLVSLEDWVAQPPPADLQLALHHRTRASLEDLSPPQSINLLIGPEGGLTAEEIALAEAQGFVAVCLVDLIGTVLAVIAHPLDVFATGGIGLGCQYTVIGKQGHAQGVG